MDWKLFSIVYISIFMAELADKTQLATLVFAAQAKNSILTVFAASALALVTATALAVFAGSLLAHKLDLRMLQTAAGIVFVLIGLWVIVQR